MTSRPAAAPAQPAAAEPAADELDRIARPAGLRLCWSDPWRFYEQRSELAARLRKLARWAREQETRTAIEAER